MAKLHQRQVRSNLTTNIGKKSSGVVQALGVAVSEPATECMKSMCILCSL